MNIDHHYLVGRRFEFHPAIVGNNQPVSPDVTFVAADPQARTVTAHFYGGGREVMDLDAVIAGVYAGLFVESERGVPFVNEGGSR